MTTNKPLTEEEVQKGECKDNYHEFTSSKHKDGKGNYIQHTPGFLKSDAHPNSLCIPCCFKKNWDSQQLSIRREECLLKQDDMSVPHNEGEPKDVGEESPTISQQLVSKKQKTVRKIKQRDADSNYILGIEYYPIPSNRYAFLPVSVQYFLQINYNSIINKKNPSIIIPNSKTFLRYGVEQSQNQSFLGCIADIYAGLHQNEGITTGPTIAEFRHILTQVISIDLYLKAHNGSLVSIFKPNKKMYEDIE
jgi:hypothetical protein